MNAGKFFLWLSSVALAGCLAGKAVVRGRDAVSGANHDLARQAYRMAGEEVLYWTLPGRYMKEGAECCFSTMADAEVVEDEQTCHEVIQQYEDTIVERIMAENQKEAIEKENNIADTEEQNVQESVPQISAEQQEESVQDGEEKKETEMPAWTDAVEASPLVNLSMDNLNDFDYLLRNFFIVDPDTFVEPGSFSGSGFLENDMRISDDASGGPQILIYHSHSQEAFSDSVPGEESDTVVGIGDYLESILTDVYGYKVIHLRDQFDMVEGYLERSRAYNYALPVVEETLAQNPSIQVVIDLHRDGVPEEKHLVTQINGKPTAQIMLFNGLSKTVDRGELESLPNPYINENLAFAFQLSYQAARYYPSFTRCIYLKGYRYNLHVRPRSILLEVGAQTNTVEEAMNAMEPFSVILNKVLKGE